MQSELKLVKEFRRKRAQMQGELDDIRESLFVANRDHKDALQKMEHKVSANHVLRQQCTVYLTRIGHRKLKVCGD